VQQAEEFFESPFAFEVTTSIAAQAIVQRWMPSIFNCFETSGMDEQVAEGDKKGFVASHKPEC
jgi:hypothetical protein|tara:strand:+ start:159 stop:347 length:189 start_codon:yes stop_codon:yes gene_type:complete